MAKKSKLKKCPYCRDELHARGMASHIAFKHPNTQMPPPIENPSKQPIETPLTKTDYGATPSRELITTTQTPKNLDIQPKFQLSVRSERTENDKSQMGPKPTKINWGLVVLAGLALWSIPQVRDDIQRCWRGETYLKEWFSSRSST